jgi:hypothetical protein
MPVQSDMIVSEYWTTVQQLLTAHMDRLGFSDWHVILRPHSAAEDPYNLTQADKVRRVLTFYFVGASPTPEEMAEELAHDMQLMLED